MGLNILSAIHGMSVIWDVRYWEVSPEKHFRFLKDFLLLENNNIKLDNNIEFFLLLISSVFSKKGNLSLGLFPYSLHINSSMCYSLQQTSCSTKHTKTSSTFYIAKGKLLLTFRLGTALKMMLPIKDIFSKSDLTFTEEILNGKFHCLCSDESKFVIFYRFIFGNKMTHTSELASPLNCR